MTYDPRVQRVAAIKQMIRQNPFIKNKNSMIGPLYDALTAAEERVAALEAEVAELKKKKAAPKKKENVDGDAAAE